MLEAAREMNAQQVNVSKLQEQIITDPDSVDIHDVTTAMAKAKMSLNLAQTVIDRLITGWNELSQNR
jgi:flagellar hook-basal body complex protein FliE